MSSNRSFPVAMLSAGAFLALGMALAQAADKHITLAYIQKQGDQQYFVDEAQGAKDEAQKLGNVSVNVINVSMDANAAISAMNVMIGQKVDGIAIVVPDQKIGPQVIDMARQAGIPIVASDDTLKDGKGEAIPFVGFDGYDMGHKVGLAAGNLFKKAGWKADGALVAAAFEEQLSVCQDRERGEEDGFKEATGGVLPQVVKIGTDNSVVDAQNRTGAVVTAHPGISHWVVWGCNDESETGAVTGAQQRRHLRERHHRRGSRRLSRLQGLAGQPEHRQQGVPFHQRPRRRRRCGEGSGRQNPQRQAASRQDGRQYHHRRPRQLEVRNGQLQLIFAASLQMQERRVPVGMRRKT